jgi:hypothetical protein
MGGSSGGLGLSIGRIAQLQEEAKAILRDGAEPERRNVFISFASEDLDYVNLLRGQAKNEDSDLEFNDWSLKEPFNSDRAEYIRRGIRERIRQSSVTLVFVSEHTAASEWVDWEIRESHRLGKGVVAMYQGESPPTVLPQALGELGVKPIQWTHEGLNQEIATAVAKPQR